MSSKQLAIQVWSSWEEVWAGDTNVGVISIFKPMRRDEISLEVRVDGDGIQRTKCWTSSLRGQGHHEEAAGETGQTHW